MAWRCWNLSPVPLERLSALAFGGMSLAMLLQYWHAEIWKKRYYKLLQPPKSVRIQSQWRHLLSSNAKLSCVTSDPCDLPFLHSLSATCPTHFGISADIVEIVDCLRKIVPQTIFHTPLIRRLVFCDGCSV